MSGLKGLIQRCTGGLLGGASETPQFIILGLDKAGKTTLLYRLKVGQSWTDMAKDMEEMRKPDSEGNVEDAGYHYEEFSSRFSHGIWEVPGTEAMRHIWSSFYKAIKIHGVIFVVDGAMTDDSRINLAKKSLHFLMNEDELRQACFCVIVNQRVDSRLKKVYNETEDELEYRLGLHKLHPTCEWRTKKFIINILELKGESDKNWLPVLDFARQTLNDPRGYGMKV